MDKKLKKIIFSKLYEDLSGVEIIQHNDSIWFIDRDNKYWYLEYFQNKTLYWRYDFFNNFFILFSIEMDEYEQVIIDWVGEVLNYKVVTPIAQPLYFHSKVGEVLNCKVVTPSGVIGNSSVQVEEVLNCKVVTPQTVPYSRCPMVEEVLNYKVVTPDMSQKNYEPMVGEVLNGNVVM